jgi:inner membrane protein
MKWVNHIAIGGAITAVWRPELVPLAVLGATAPDWMEWALKAIGIHVGHRTVTHYVAYWVMGILFGLFAWDWHYAITAFCAGGLSHVMCDACTIAGVPMGWWSDRKFNLFGGRLRTGNMGEYWVAGAVVLLCFGLAMATRSWGHGGYAPFFTDWADCYKQGLCSAAEWKANRLKWF